jgi:hypothetical protein
VPGIEQYPELRQALGGYNAIVEDTTRVKNGLKAIYRSRGLWEMYGEVCQWKSRVPWASKLSASHPRLAELLGEELDGLVELREQAGERLHQKTKKHPLVRRLATAPGLGACRGNPDRAWRSAAGTAARREGIGASIFPKACGRGYPTTTQERD